MPARSEQDVFEPIVRGVAQSGVRVANERAVLTLIAGIPGVSNADIARRSGLGPQTTARILADLEARDLIVRGEVLRGRRGQPATPYRLNPESAYAIGVEIGWDHLELVLQNMAGDQVVVRRLPLGLSLGPDAVLHRLQLEVQSLVGALDPLRRQRLVGIGLAMPALSLSLFEHMRIGAAYAAWSGFDMAGRLSSATGLPVSSIDSGTAAAWCEVTMMAPPRPHGIVAFFIGSVVGGGVISGGSLLEGGGGRAGDLGAVVVAGPDGKPSPLHCLASIDALQRRLAAAGIRPEPASPRDWNWDLLEPVVGQWIEEAASALAQATLSAAAIIEIDIAVINGDLPPTVLQRLLARTEASLGEVPALVHVTPRLVMGQCGPTSPAWGASRLLMFRSHFSRAWDLFEGDLGK